MFDEDEISAKKIKLEVDNENFVKEQFLKNIEVIQNMLKLKMNVHIEREKGLVEYVENEEKRADSLNKQLDLKERKIKEYQKENAELQLIILRQQKDPNAILDKCKICKCAKSKTNEGEENLTFHEMEEELYEKGAKIKELKMAIQTQNLYIHTIPEVNERLENLEKENEKLTKESIRNDDDLRRLTEEVKDLEMNYKGQIMKTEKARTEREELTTHSNRVFRNQDHQIKKLNNKIEQLKSKLSKN
eukprot:GFUD01128936.1.p1 GENE.GFUD01128936.1~~GFUD01128936.1.p1  ORF type:complete len:246 (-),score=78.98 GFUD01128936.1:39-776(-)